MSFKRFLAYIVVGVSFGVIDWYGVQALLPVTHRLSRGNLALALMGEAVNWGVWLLPATPVAVYEARRSGKAVWSGMAVVTLWLSSIVAYYLYYTYLLAFVGVHRMEDLLIFGPRPNYFWGLWAITMRSLILRQMGEWGMVALVGGFIVGWLVSWVYLRWRPGQPNVGTASGTWEACITTEKEALSQ
jgi:hypothetical protein